MLRVLSIGNSFSQDAQAMLHNMARHTGIALKSANLYIPGCSLRRHWVGVEGQNRDALYEQNGVTTDRHISILEALSMDEWDIVTLQQSSGHSGQYDTFFPYLSLLSERVARHIPPARQYLHETWAYEEDCDHPHFGAYGRSQRRMFEALREANHRASARTGLPLIPSGELIQALRGTPPFDPAQGGLCLTRDGFHLNLTYGRWAVSALWLEIFCGVDARTIRFVPAGASPPLLTGIAEMTHKISTGR